MPSQLETISFPEDLLRNPQRIEIRQQFSRLIEGASKAPARMKSPGAAKDLRGIQELIFQAITDKQNRAQTAEKARVKFTEEFPDFTAESQTVTFSVEKSVPGSFGEGGPFESNVKNLRPILREEVEDTDFPGYKVATLGYYYDNLIKLTCFARTNKEANVRTTWLQKLMSEYMWWYTWQGVNRILFWERQPDFFIEENGAKLYGRPLLYFVRTEELTVLRERVLEELIVDTGLTPQLSVLSVELK